MVLHWKQWRSICLTKTVDTKAPIRYYIQCIGVFFMVVKKTDRYTYTQEQWDRDIGYGKVPKKYQNKDEKNGTSTDKQRK